MDRTLTLLRERRMWGSKRSGLLLNDGFSPQYLTRILRNRTNVSFVLSAFPPRSLRPSLALQTVVINWNGRVNE